MGKTFGAGLQTARLAVSAGDRPGWLHPRPIGLPGGAGCHAGAALTGHITRPPPRSQCWPPPPRGGAMGR